MKVLIVEDDLTSRILMRKILEQYGPVHVAEDGRQGVEAVRIALKTGQPFDLICLDIMMPKMDGQTALKEIREMEDAMGIGPGRGAKVIMTTALSDSENVIKAGRQQCSSYLLKPVSRVKLIQELHRLGLIQPEARQEEAGGAGG